ncbi:MAG: hypothetical protein JSR21_16165 [Proteobacteria bacterium]|nr:hypothetical protein [Pseudomonadota bacterium]
MFWFLARFSPVSFRTVLRFVALRDARTGGNRACATACALAAASLAAAPRPGAAAWAPGLAPAEDCSDIDPNGELAAITGDFELTADPDDPQGRVLFVSNATGGVLSKQNVLIARLDGVTGVMISGTVTVIADNFYGNSDTNGPEWFRTPQGNEGVIYAGRGGVHMALRPPAPGIWNGFQYDYSGAPTEGSPPPLPNTQSGSYANPPNKSPGGGNYYAGYGGSCTSLCFADYLGGTATDVGKVLAAQGYTLHDAADSPWDGTIYYSACKVSTGACGIFTASIDGSGGLIEQTLVARTGLLPAPQIAAYRHPLTGVVVVFTNSNPTRITVWVHPGPNTQMALLTNVDVPAGAVHFRTAASATQVVLNFLIKPGQGGAVAGKSVPGSYTIAVSAAENGALSASPARRISMHGGGAELDWYPAAGRWRIVYRTDGNRYAGCWVTP